MRMTRIAPKMEGMHEVEGMAVITIEATRDEAAQVGELMFKPVFIGEDSAYVEATDLLVEFIDQTFERESWGTVPAVEAYELFSSWWVKRFGDSVHLWSQKTFGKYMASLGIGRGKSGGRVLWNGIAYTVKGDGGEA